MNLLPSGRFLLLLSAAALLFPINPAAALVVDGVLLALFAADALLLPGAAALRVTRIAPGRLSLGATGEVSFDLENDSTRTLRVRVTDDLPPILLRDGPDACEAVLQGGRDARCGYRVLGATTYTFDGRDYGNRVLARALTPSSA